MNHKLRWLAFIASLIILFSQSSHVSAGIYKCVSADGETTYSQTVCPKDSDSSRYSSNHSGVKKSNSMDCGLARKFAETTGEAMRSGKPSSTVYNRYGGISSMSGPAVSIVNYVYTFENNYQTTIERIGGLTHSRCENGSFGDTSCDNFPSQFVSQAGGCDLSKIDVNGSNEYVDESSYQKVSVAANPRKITRRVISTEEYQMEQEHVNCQTAILQKLEMVDKKTGTVMTHGEYTDYQMERNELRREFDNC